MSWKQVRETMEYKKICPICGAHFETNNDQTVYCGHSCKAEAKRARDREYQRIKREQASESRRQYREEYERVRLSEIAERERKSKEDFERRCKAGDPQALLIREKMLRGNSSVRYWELFAQCEIEEAERAGNISRLAVNGISVYEHDFAGAVLESIESQGYIVMELGRKSK